MVSQAKNLIIREISILIIRHSCVLFFFQDEVLELLKTSAKAHTFQDYSNHGIHTTYAGLCRVPVVFELVIRSTIHG